MDCRKCTCADSDFKIYATARYSFFELKLNGFKLSRGFPIYCIASTGLSSAAGGAKAKNFVREADARGDCCIFGAGPGVVFLMAAIMADLFGVFRPIGISCARNENTGLSSGRRDKSRLYKVGRFGEHGRL